MYNSPLYEPLTLAVTPRGQIYTFGAVAYNLNST